MPNYNSLRRYYFIMDVLRDRQGASFKKIKDYLEQRDISMSSRTLQRDINQLRTDFSIDINYDRDSNRYSLSAATSLDIGGFYNYLELVVTRALFDDLAKNKKEYLLQRVQFEPVNNLKGFEHLSVLMNSILLKKWIEFDYKKFSETTFKHHKVIPCFLKRYQSRWYLLGKLKNEKVATFGIDRISNLSITKTGFSEGDVEKRDLFKDTIGLTRSPESVKILLKVIPMQAEYLKSLPLHSSQKIVDNTGKWIVFEYYVTPNFEFIQEILKLGDYVELVEPKSLRTRIARIVSNSHRLYSKHPS